jgi:hypothetical protein
MNHPSLKNLQDYFEAEVNSLKIKSHLDSCDRCSLIVGQMAKVDILFSKTNEVIVSESVKTEIFSKASFLLKQKREQVELDVVKKNMRVQKKEEILKRISMLRSNALAELQMPILQSAALMVLLVVFTKVSTTHREIEHYKIIENDTAVFYSELQGDEDEDS